MTTTEAIQVIKQVADSVSATPQQHKIIQEAIKTLEDATKTK